MTAVLELLGAVCLVQPNGHHLALDALTYDCDEDDVDCIYSIFIGIVFLFLKNSRNVNDKLIEHCLFWNSIKYIIFP